MSDSYMSPRGFLNHKELCDKRIYQIVELFDCFHCFVYKEYRRVYLTDIYGNRLPELPGMVSELRFLPISHLKLDCQLVTTDLSLSGRDRKLASIEIARKPKKPRSAQILVNDIMSFSEQPYSYRRAMLEYYIKDGEAVVKNPRLYTGDSSKAVEIWCDWAR